MTDYSQLFQIVFLQKLTRKASEGSDSGVASQDDEMSDTKCRRENAKLSTTSSSSMSASHQVRPEADVLWLEKNEECHCEKRGQRVGARDKD